MSVEVDLSQLARRREERPAGPRRARSHALTRYVLPGLLLLGFAALAAWSLKDAAFPPREVTVVPIHATQGALRRAGTPLFKAAGWIEPRPTPIRIAALAPGVIEKLLVVEDQPVQAGEPVAQLVDQDARLAHERAAAELTLKKAEIDEAQAALTAAQTRLLQPAHLAAPLGEAEAALAQIETQRRNLPFEIRRAKAQWEYADRNYQGKASTPGAISGRIIDLAKSDLATAAALLEELQARTDSLDRERSALAARRDALQTRLELKADEIQAQSEAEARLQIAQARARQSEIAVAEAQLRLDRMTVRAPATGRILRLVADPGARLMDFTGSDSAADGSTVVTMYRPESLQVRADVRFEDIPKVRLDQPVRIESPALSESLLGKVLFVSSEANIQKNTLQVKVAIETPPAVLKPEMLVDVTFLAPDDPVPKEAAPETELRLLVPQSVIHRGDAGSFVWVADQSEGVAKRVPIDVGAATSEGLVEVGGGLTISSRLIATGHEHLADGDRIRVTGEAAPGDATSNPSAGDGMKHTPSRLPSGDLE